MFGSMNGGGLLGLIQRGGQAMGTPAVPADGAMQPTIGPGMAPAAPQAPVKIGLPPGGILGLLQGQSPQGLMGLLQRATQPQAGAAPNPLAAAGVGMMSGLPGTPGASAESPVAPRPQLPMNINPMDQF